MYKVERKFVHTLARGTHFGSRTDNPSRLIILKQFFERVGNKLAQSAKNLFFQYSIQIIGSICEFGSMWIWDWGVWEFVMGVWELVSMWMRRCMNLWTRVYENLWTRGFWKKKKNYSHVHNFRFYRDFIW